MLGICDWWVVAKNKSGSLIFLGCDMRSSRASLNHVGGAVVIDFGFLVAVFRLCHCGSDKLSSLSVEPCHGISLLSRVSSVFTSSGMKPLNFSRYFWRLIFSEFFCIKLTEFWEFWFGYFVDWIWDNFEQNWFDLSVWEWPLPECSIVWVLIKILKC